MIKMSVSKEVAKMLVIKSGKTIVDDSDWSEYDQEVLVNGVADKVGAPDYLIDKDIPLDLRWKLLDEYIYSTITKNGGT